MKKYIKLVITYIFLILNFQLLISFAHPLDISSSFFSIKWNNANVTTYFHSYEIEYLLTQSGKPPKVIQDYYQNQEYIKSYLKNNTKFYNNSKLCKISDIQTPQLEEYQVLTKWFEVDYSFNCEDNIRSWEIQITFFNNFKLQTNKLIIYDLNNWIENITPSYSKVLTTKIDNLSFDLQNKQTIKSKDSDWDWLTDDEEKIYKTDPQKIDTDGDKYTDYEEVTGSWDPIKKEFWPWQKYREEIPQWVLDNIAWNIKSNSDNLWSASWLLSSWYWMEYLQNVLKKINEYIKNNSHWFWYIFWMVIALWFIHAFWPWHSKSLLISYAIDKDNWFIKWIWFALVFTITHLIDIVILFLVAKFVFQFYDISNYMIYIQRFSLTILIIFSVYLIYKNINKINNKELITKNNTIEKTFSTSNWSGWLIWLVAWLAPCTFGWSIFLLLFSLWTFAMILPMILALWIWIFICLVLILVITLFIKNKIYAKVWYLSTYSSLISSSILLFLWIYLLYTIL